MIRGLTAESLIELLNCSYGLEKDWPKTLDVDAITYAHCCQYVFNWHILHQTVMLSNELTSIRIWLGPNNGLLFKNVELILKP